MEERKHCGCGLPFTLVFILAFPATFLFLNSDFLCELRSEIVPQIFGNSSSHANKTVPPYNFYAAEISPNLTSCHDSWGREDLLINCCPPLPDKDMVPINFQFPTPSKSGLRIRRPMHRLDEEYLAKYTKALKIMKSLPHSDPRSFSRQAIIHCTFCSGAYDMWHSFNVPGGTGPVINIHRQWMFYPFHRMYLHFHERILGSLIGDDTFALPFWAWDHPDAMSFPDLFTSPPFTDTQRDPLHFPPATVDLYFDDEISETNVLAPPEQVRANLAIMYNQVISAARRPELFMGCPLTPSTDGFCDGPGTVELAPHNTVHTWVGSAANPGRENMGSFYSAAWDPSFYPHHCNIDRIWDVWRNVHGIDVPINDPVWLNSYFYFYDEKLNLVKIKVSDVLNVTSLGYAYEDVELLWLNQKPKPSVEPKIAKHGLKLREQRDYDNGVRVNEEPMNMVERNLSRPVRVKVDRPKRYRSEEEKREEEEILVVYGINTSGGAMDGMVKFEVYVNLVDETKLGPSYREFVGTYVDLRQGMSRNNSTLKVGISEALEDLEADEDESVWVTVIPRTKACSGVTIGGTRIEYMR